MIAIQKKTSSNPSSLIMSSPALHILHFNNHADNVAVIGHILKNGNIIANIQVAETKIELMKALHTSEPDLILIGHGSNVDSLNDVSALKTAYPDIPLIVAGPENDVQMIDYLWHGASDYIHQSNLDRLPYAIERALLLRRMNGERHKTSDRIMLQSSETVNRIAPRAFVLHRPKQEIGGDFYFFAEVENGFIVASADCTGHGIPGALISIMGHRLLNKIVVDEKITRPAAILRRLHEAMRESFRRDNRMHSEHDGIEIAVCLVDRKKQILQFAGASQSLFFFINDRLVVFHGEKRTIGAETSNCETNSTTHKIEYKPGDRFYLTSDGFYDQFGGPDKTRLMKRNFTALLKLSNDMPIAEQRTFMEEKFDSWRGSNEQTDDMHLIGVQL